ncbi:MAG: hypothetical protein KDA29_12180 [Phycisphaerales bacterium]|nr:hypothetical protein [Phycisphaerales bacterium]
MGATPPSRLPSAFIRVSRCPICRYSLKDLAPDAPCPECGQDIDRDLFTSPEIQDAVTQTRAWCTLGIAAWALIAIAYWGMSTAMLSVLNSYYPGVYGANHYAGVWCRTAIVIAPIALSCSWHRHARRIIYRHASRRADRKPTLPKRVIAINGLGMGLFLLGCLRLLP